MKDDNKKNEKKLCTIHGVIGSFIKELNWVDEPKKNLLIFTK